MSQLSIRAAQESDLPALTRLYNHYVSTSPVTFDVSAISVEARRSWFRHYASAGPHRLLVACEGERPVGYASSSRFREKAAYEPTVETTIYLDPDATGRGIGTRLYGALLEGLEGEDVHRAVAGITLPNPPSIDLHRRLGFREVGTFDEVGRKFGRYWSVQWYEKRLG